MRSACLCWHKLSAGWLASGRLPAVTFTMRVRWLYCEGATPLRIPPHVPKPTLRWRIDARGGLECPRLFPLTHRQSDISCPFSRVFFFFSSHPICFNFGDGFYICSRSLLWVCVNNKPPGYRNIGISCRKHVLRQYTIFCLGSLCLKAWYLDVRAQNHIMNYKILGYLPEFHLSIDSGYLANVHCTLQISLYLFTLETYVCHDLFKTWI